MKLRTTAPWCVAALAVVIVGTQEGAAQSYPAKPVRILVGFPPSGGNDVVARIVATRLSERWNQSIVVENRPGATGTVAANVVARAPADGYMLLGRSEYERHCAVHVHQPPL